MATVPDRPAVVEDRRAPAQLHPGDLDVGARHHSEQPVLEHEGLRLLDHSPWRPGDRHVRSEHGQFLAGEVVGSRNADGVVDVPPTRAATERLVDEGRLERRAERAPPSHRDRLSRDPIDRADVATTIDRAREAALVEGPARIPSPLPGWPALMAALPSAGIRVRVGPPCRSSGPSGAAVSTRSPVVGANGHSPTLPRMLWPEEVSVPEHSLRLLETSTLPATIVFDRLIRPPPAFATPPPSPPPAASRSAVFSAIETLDRVVAAVAPLYTPPPSPLALFPLIVVSATVVVPEPTVANAPPSVVATPPVRLAPPEREAGATALDQGAPRGRRAALEVHRLDRHPAGAGGDVKDAVSPGRAVDGDHPGGAVPADLEAARRDVQVSGGICVIHPAQRERVVARRHLDDVSGRLTGCAAAEPRVGVGGLNRLAQGASRRRCRSRPPSHRPR